MAKLQLRRLNLVLCLLIISSTACTAADAGQPTFSDEAFLDSVGMNVHLGTVGDRSNRFGVDRDLATTEGLLRELGVHHIRDVFWLNATKQHEAYNQLARSGIRSDLVIIRPKETNDSVQDCVKELKRKFPSMLLTLSRDRTNLMGICDELIIQTVQNYSSSISEISTTQLKATKC